MNSFRFFFFKFFFFFPEKNLDAGGAVDDVDGGGQLLQLVGADVGAVRESKVEQRPLLGSMRGLCGVHAKLCGGCVGADVGAVRESKVEQRPLLGFVRGLRGVYVRFTQSFCGLYAKQTSAQ